MVSCYRLSLFSVLCACALAADPAPTSYNIQTVAGTDDSGNGGSALSVALGQPEGVAVDHEGNVYFAEAANNRIRKIASDGFIQTVAGTGVAGFAGDGGPASAALLNQPYGIALDSSGNLYIADLGNARVRKISTNGDIQTVAGGGALPATGTGQGGPATMAQLMQPRDVALDGAGSLYISDFGASQVYQVSSSGILSLIAGTGTAGYSGVATSALLAQLNAPAGLAVDPSGAVYIADSGNNLVRKIYNGVIIDVFNTPAPTGVALDSTGMLYIAASNYFGTVVQAIAGVAAARDVAVDSKGNIYATSAAFVVEIPNNESITTIAGSGTAPYFGGDGGPATRALLNAPADITVDSSGNWYIADTSNNRVRIVTPAGVISTLAGTGTAGSSGDNGPATAAELNSPRAIAIDSSNNLYIADAGNNAIRKITPGGAISTLAAQLNNPLSVAVDSTGSLYVADSGNNRIAQITATGTVSTFSKIQGVLAVAVDPSGNILAADATQIWKVAPDGTATSLVGGLTSPNGLTLAADGTLLIADTGADVIRQFSPSGVLTAIAGTGTAGFSGDGSSALSAELNAPAGVAIGADGTILIADSLNNRIRSLTPAAASPDAASISLVNAASLAAGPIAPSEIVTVFGTGFDRTNTQLLFNGKPATLFYTQRDADQRARPRNPGGKLDCHGQHYRGWRHGRRLSRDDSHGRPRHFHHRRCDGSGRRAESRRKPELGVQPRVARIGSVNLRDGPRSEYQQCHAHHCRLQRASALCRTRARLPWVDAGQCADSVRFSPPGHSSRRSVGRGGLEPARRHPCDPLTLLYQLSILMHMRSTLNIDDHLLEEARRLTGITEKTALVRAGLEALIAREVGRRLAALGGTQPEFEAAPRKRGHSAAQ